ncbi:FtsX-like permease family protein [Streptomyces sp. NRRL F-2890]|uniref:FtsX-like permease family protein n=1 Tax=Streptomyces sp. NRRL F-2890 TaxID=1463845 RepID=UPI0005BC2BDE|nr:FtsX-like permease family protein [Streptomyces sp. NRRL F-2890]
MKESLALLARASGRYHRRSWRAVSLALAATSLLLGCFALAALTTAFGHPEPERYAGAEVVVAADQHTRHRGATAPLTERVRVPRTVVDLLESVPGVARAVADEEFTVRTDTVAQLPGRPWPAAALAPWGLVAGREPVAADEVVASAGLGVPLGAELDVRVGQDTSVRRVVGLAEGPAALWFTAPEAAALAGHPDSVDAIGLLAEPGVGAGAVRTAVRQALDAAGAVDARPQEVRPAGDFGTLRALTGDGRGAAESLTAQPVRTGLLALFGAIGGSVLLIAGLVLATLVARALRQRAGELALLHAVGATAGQLRGAVAREVAVVAARAALLGAVASVPLFVVLWPLVTAEAAPYGLALPVLPWTLPAPLITAGLTVATAVLATLPATGGATGAPRSRTARPACAPRPTPAADGRQAGPGVGEAGPAVPAPAARFVGSAAPPVPPPGPGGRKAGGLVLLGMGLMSAAGGAVLPGEGAAAAAGAAVVVMVIGCALLGPWIAAWMVAVTGGALRRFGGVGGRLAAAQGRAGAPRLGAAVVSIVLVTAFAVVQLAAGATAQRAGEQQARATGPAEGIHSTVLVARSELGEAVLDRLPVLGVTPGDPAFDPGVRDGDLAGLGTGTVAVGADRARTLGAGVGDTVTLRYGDGVEESLRIVAVYTRSLAVGDFLFDRAQLAAHVADPAASAAPVRTPVALEGAVLESGLSATAVAGLCALALLAVFSTLAVSAVGRRPELELLHRLGAGRGQLWTMLVLEAALVALTGMLLGVAVAAVPLLGFSWAVLHTLPWLPPLQAALIGTAVLLTTAAGALLPARRALRVRR